MNFIRTFATKTGGSIVVNHEFHKIIKHVRPEKLRPWSPQRTCDLQSLPKIDPNWLTVKNRPFADSINKLPEEKRKLFTVGFAKRSESIKVILEDALSKVRRHKYDNSSREFMVTWATIKIRSFQHLVATDKEAYRLKHIRTGSKELTEKRKKWLTLLRREDYRRFEWLIEILGIIYKPNHPYTRIERKASLNVIVNQFCNEIRQKKMQEYKDLLESEKIPFLRQKLETLKEIEKEEASINLSSSVEEDIRDVTRLLTLMNTPDNPHYIADFSITPSTN